MAADGEVGSALNIFEGKRVRLLVAGQVAVQPGGQTFWQLPALRPLEVGVMLSMKQRRQFRRELDPVARQGLAGALVLPAKGRDHGQRDGVLGAFGIESQRGGLQAREAFAQMGVGLAGGCPADCLAETVWRKFHGRAQRGIAGYLDQLQPDRGIVLPQFLARVGDAPLADDRQCFLPQITALLIAVARVEQRTA